MNLGRAFAVARKTLRTLKHDRRTAGFLVIMPLLMITIFGYTFGGDVKNISVYVVNLDTALEDESVAVAMIEDLLTRDALDIELLGNDGTTASGEALVASASEKVKDGEIWAAVIFGRNFTEDVVERTSTGTGLPAQIEVVIDGTNPNIVQAVYNDLQVSIRNVLGAYAVTPPIVVSQNLVYGEGAEFIDFFAPGVMGLAAMMVTFMLSILSFVRERGTSTLDRLLSTPATEGEIVAGYALAFGFVGLVQSVVILVAAVLLFDIDIVGNPLLVLFVIFLFGVGTQGLGFLLSSFAKNEFQALQFIPLILFPSILLSGVFWPIEAVPELLRPVSYFIPLTYAVEGCRSTMIRGWGALDIWPQLLILAAFAAVMLLASTYGLKRRR